MNIPHLNQQQCFKLIPPKDLSLNSQKLPSDWLDRLAMALNNELPAETELFRLKQELIRHTGNRYYPYTDELKKALQHIYLHVFSDHAPSINPDLKKKIADKLIDSINECTEGYHTSVNEALGSYSTPQNIDELLSIIRNGLITNIVFNNNWNDVHTIAGFFNLANKLQLGVTASKDPAAGNFTNNERAKDRLITAFETHYRTIPVFEGLTNQINNILRESFGYHGLAKTSTECYDLTDCKAMLSYLKSVFDVDMDLDPKDYFIMSLRSEWIDLNWPKINHLLFTQLINKDYFNFTPHEVNCFNALFEANFKGIWNTILNCEVNTLKAALHQEYNYQGAVEPENAYQPAEATQFFDYLKNILCFEAPEDLFFERTIDGEIIDINWEQVKQECFAFFQELGCLPFADLNELSQITSLEKTDFADFPELGGMMLFLKEFTDVTILEKYIESLEMESFDEQCNVLKILLTTYSENITLTNFLDKSIQNLTNTPALEENIINLIKQTLRSTSSSEQITLAMRFYDHLTPSKKINLLLSDDDFMQLASKKHPSLIMPILLNTIIELSSEDMLAAIKTQLKHTNPLIDAIQYHPKAMQSMLSYASSNHSDLLFQLLSTKDPFGHYALLCAAEKYPDALDNLLHALHDLSNEQQLTVINQTNAQGNNLLLIAATYLPEIISDLISSIPEDALNNILLNQNAKGENLLMILTKQHPQSLLNVMSTLSSSDLTSLLLQTNQDEETNNIFMIAAKYHSIDLMQELIEISPPDYLENMFVQQNSQGDNLLRMAARYHPEMLLMLIQASNTDGIDILKTQNLNHKNTLNIVAEHHPEFLPVLIQNLSPAYFREVLASDYLVGQNIVLLTMCHHPDDVLFMIKTIMDNISTEDQIALFSEAFRHTNCSYKKELHIAIQIAQLDKKASEFNQHSKAYEEAKTLHAKLNTEFKIYLQSNHQPEDLLTLQTATQAAMSTAHRTLATHRGYKDFWIQALVCVTGIGLLCLLAKKALDYYQVGFFRPITNTKSVTIMNAIQEEINALAPLP